MGEYSSFEDWTGAILGRYRLAQLLGQSELGPLFMARHEAMGAPVQIRVLPVRAAATTEDVAAYTAHLERQAGHIATLRHPYILPLVDYGLHRGLPYLVWPQLVMRSLGVRLTQSGSMDIVTVGRYLDQIAAALDYAHERATVHRNLSTDCIFIQLDGQLVVTDFGVRRLLEILGQDASTDRFYGSLEACAPEQLLGGRIDAYTDVYALGGVTYRLLTGRPVFRGDTREALVEQHLHVPPAPLSGVRSGLPAGLESVLAAALAKDPAQRFQHPGALANAYHQVVAPNSPTRVPFVASAPAEQRLSRPLAPAAAFAAAGHASATAAPRERLESYPASRSTSSPERPPRSSDPLGGDSAVPPYGVESAPSGYGASTGRRWMQRPIERVAVAMLLLLVVVASGVFIAGGGHTVGGHTTGSAAFLDNPNGSPGHTDALQFAAHGLAGAASGSHYDAWVVDQKSEQSLLLGVLIKSADGAYALDTTGAGGGGVVGTNLLAAGDKLEVTEERGSVTAPVGPVRLSGAFPPQAFVHIRHLLVGFPTTPGKIGLLVGTLFQTQALNTQATALQAAAAGRDVAAVQCDAQNILNIIEGSQGAHYQPLGAGCAAAKEGLAGDGFGLLNGAPSGKGGAGNGGYGDQGGAGNGGYLDFATDHASLAATQPDATAGIRLYAGNVEATLATIKGWVSMGDQDAVKLLSAPGDPAAAADLVKVCGEAYHGVKGRADRTASPAPGEGGALTAYAQGQLMATLTMASGG